MHPPNEPTIVTEIEALLGNGFRLSPAPDRPTILDGLMAFKKDTPKYALDESGKLIGLNLAETELTDEQWHKVSALLEQEKVRLKALDLSDNQLENLVLPGRASDLVEFEVENNPLKKPPKQIVEQGSEAILNFFRQIEEQDGAIPLYEAKLLIVGEPGAGKTTLLEKLKNPDYIVPPNGDKTIKSTTGINIYEGWSFPFPDKEGIIFKTNLWDFGGQEIQYMTHHFFLTPRALYVLVADDRKQNTEFDYWFRIINLLGKENSEEKISVLVILNAINHVSVTNFDLSRYRSNYPDMNIQMWDIDFSKKDYQSDNLASKTQEMLCSLPHIGDLLPRLWIPIREDLLKTRAQKPHITFAEFAAICSREKEGKRLEKEKDQRMLSGYLHRLGVVLHYQDDDALDNFVILNPQWAVDAVYSVLKDSRVKKNQGRFTQEDLRDFWKDYSSDERSRLLSLMLKDRFEICYRSPQSGEYIAPQLLPGQRPTFEWGSDDTMKFRYQYAFMPKGLISRLIVRLSDDIAGEGEWVWSEGVVIEQKGCQALIVQQKTIKEGLEVLEIELRGRAHERKFLLRHIRTEVEKIHEKSFKHIAFERMIPCVCIFCKNSAQPAFFEYSVLLQYQEEGWDEIDCGEVKLKKVSVRALLDGVFEREREMKERVEQGTSLHFHISPDTEMRKDIKEVREDTKAIRSNQEYQQKYLDSLLVYAEDHRSAISLVFTKIDTAEANNTDLIRINDFLEKQLDQYFTQLPAANPLVQKWQEAKDQQIHVPDAKWKLKLKFPFLFGSFEKELSYDLKIVLKHIRSEITAFQKGEKTLKQLFIEEK